MTEGDGTRALFHAKVWRKPGMVFGAAGSLACAQRVRYAIQAEPPGPKDIARWLVTELAPCIAELSTEHAPPPALLIIVHGEIWGMDGAGAATRAEDGFWAIGSGASLAIGAMAALRTKPRARVRRAVEVAARFGDGCLPPVHSMWVRS